jgi:hypothetical protein
VEPQPTEKVAYQGVLRALGAYLDQESMSRFRLIEVPDGFTLVLEAGGAEPHLREVHFSTASLLEQGEQLARGRKMFGGKYQERWSLASTGHQDFLRALGNELDRYQAHDILIDELEDGLLVTYTYVDPSKGYQFRKRLSVLHAQEIEAILQSAHGRRHRRSLLR